MEVGASSKWAGQLQMGWALLICPTPGVPNPAPGDRLSCKVQLQLCRTVDRQEQDWAPLPYTKPNPKPTLPLGAAQPTCSTSPSHLEVSGLQHYILAIWRPGGSIADKLKEGVPCRSGVEQQCRDEIFTVLVFDHAPQLCLPTLIGHL